MGTHQVLAGARELDVAQELPLRRRAAHIVPLHLTVQSPHALHHLVGAAVMQHDGQGEGAEVRRALPQRPEPLHEICWHLDLVHRPAQALELVNSIVVIMQAVMKLEQPKQTQSIQTGKTRQIQ